MDFSKLVIDYENTHENTQKLNTYNLLYRYGIIRPELYRSGVDLSIHTCYIDPEILGLIKTMMDNETSVSLVYIYKSLVDKMMTSADKLALIIYSKEVDELINACNRKMSLINQIKTGLVELKTLARKYDGVWSIHTQEDEDYLLNPPSMKGDITKITEYLTMADKIIRVKVKNFFNDRMMEKFIKKINECLDDFETC
jgi:hypothetical protein